MYDEILARVRARIRDRIVDLPTRDARIEQAFTAISDEMNPYMTATVEGFGTSFFRPDTSQIYKGAGCVVIVRSDGTSTSHFMGTLSVL